MATLFRKTTPAAGFLLVLGLVLVCFLTLATAAGAQETTTEAPRPDAVAESGVVADETSAPEIGAGSWALMDIRSGKVLAEKRGDERVPMASTTKIMLVLLTLEAANLEEEVIISEEAASFAVPLYSNVGLFPGDSVSVWELLMASMISSGDDAAYALAEHLGGGSVEQFVEKMNREAGSLGLRNTHFENPVGLDGKEHYSSARDLADMTRRAFQYPMFRQMVSTSEATISTQDRVIPLANTNELLFTYAPATGVKTGTTPAAGPSLVASAASGDESYIAVVLDDKRRFEDAAVMLEHGFTVYDRRGLIVENERYSEVEVPYRRDEKIDLVAEEGVQGLVENETPNIEQRIKVNEELPASARPGTKLGTITVNVDGERVGESALVARQGYEEAPLWQKLWYTVEGIFG